MSTPEVHSRVNNGVRGALLLGGVLALLAGLFITLWPSKSAVLFTWVLVAYAAAVALAYAGLGIFSRALSGISRIGHVLLGVVFFLAAVLIMVNLLVGDRVFNLPRSTIALAAFSGILVGIMWIVEGVVSLTTLGGAASKGFTVFFAILSIIAGIILLMSPLWAAVVLWWLLGISLVVLGIIQIVRAFTFKAKAL